MGEAGAAAELLTSLPDTAEGDLDSLRLQTLFAADQTDAACDLADRLTDDDPTVDRARLVCAGIVRDPARVALLLSVAAERGQTVDPLLSSLLLASGGNERVILREPPPDDALLLPLLRRVPLQPEGRALTAAPPLVRQAIAANPNVPAGLAPPAVEPKPLPTFPGLGGQPITDWPQALRTVPEAARPRWLAAMDGLGAGPSDVELLGVPETARLLGGGRTDLAAWRGLEAAMQREERGSTLLATLLLLDGRPGEASPLALRAALMALARLGLERDAGAVAAAGVAGRPS
jgi:hypothetical protein